MKSQRTNQYAITMESLVLQKIFVKENMVYKNLNPSLLVIVFTTRNKDIKHLSVGQEWGMHLLHLDLKDIAITIKSMGIDHMNADLKQNLIRQIKGRFMHLTMHVPNVTSLDIKETIVGLKNIQQIKQKTKAKAKWTLKKSIEAKMVCKILILSLLDTIFIVRNKDIKYSSLGQYWGIKLLHLNLKDNAITIKTMGIEHMSTNHR